MILKYQVNDEDYQKFIKYLKTCLVVKNTDTNITCNDVVVILPSNITDMESFKETDCLGYQILSIDFDSEGIKKGYMILNLCPIYNFKDSVTDTPILDTQILKKECSCLAKS